MAMRSVHIGMLKQLEGCHACVYHAAVGRNVIDNAAHSDTTTISWVSSMLIGPMKGQNACSNSNVF